MTAKRTQGSKRTRGGRVTPKGTQNPSKKKPTAEAPTTPKPKRYLPADNAVEKGRASRPITHHRGNR